MTPLQQKNAVAALAFISIATTLAACSATPAASTTDDTSSSDTSTPKYKDGLYVSTQDYQSPNGTETIDVTITLSKDIIIAVDVVGHGTSPDSKLHQKQFRDGIAGVVVGKDIDDIDVHKVGGSSLTSEGFNEAVEIVKADAAL